MLHYAEVEARLQHGEGGGACLSIGHPLRKSKVRHCLKLASEQLEQARTKWLKEETLERSKTEAVRKMIKTTNGAHCICER